MNRNLYDIIDIEKWQSLQDALALTTRTAIITVDYKGIPVTRHSRCQKFCELVRSDKKLSHLCQKCDSRGGLEAIRLGHPYIYLCHFGIVDAAIPILVDERYLGATMVGQVTIPAQDHRLEYIAAATDRKLLAGHSEKYEAYYRNLPESTFENVRQTTDLLFQLSRYIVSEAIEKNVLLQVNSAAFSIEMPVLARGRSVESKAEMPALRSEHAVETSDIEAFPLARLEKMNRTISDAITNARVADALEQKHRFRDDILQPAFDYMHANKHELLKMEEMAKLCHVSTGYFSKRFKRMTGDNFSNYAARLKDERKKKMLETTDTPVSQIAYDLGYEDVSYFSRVFRKHENTTPSQYRKYYGKA